MGLFDSIKNALGKSGTEPEVTTAPSQLLREAGLDPSGLRFGFGNASISVSGQLADESQRQRVIEVLSGIPGIDSVQDNMVVAEQPPPAAVARAAEDARPEPDAAEAAPTGSRRYTVESGDTLWKIAERMYGNGSQYMKIFEANTDVLEQPDRIFPGQKLVIPD